MESLLSVPSIVFEIARNLDTVDYLNFRRINKLVYQTQLNPAIDVNIWNEKLTLMGLKHVSSLKTPLDIKSSNLDLLDLFQTFKEFDDENSRLIFSIFFKAYNKMIIKLLNNKYAKFFPSKYENDPLNQAKILTFLEIYNKSSAKCDFSRFTKVQTNLNILREIFVNSILQEMETSYQLKDYTKTASFVKILLVSHEENNAIEFFNSKVEFPNVQDIVLPTKDQLLSLIHI